MRHSIWYRTEEKQPPKSGHYLAYRGWGMGGKADGDHDHGYVYYDKKKNEWRDRKSEDSYYAIVYYWTDATPDDWTDQDPPSIKIKPMNEHEHVAVQDAWRDVEEALKRYETVRILCDKSNI